MNTVRAGRLEVFVIIFLCFFCDLIFAAPPKGWKRKDVDIRAGDGRRIRGIYYPEGKEVLLRKEKKTRLRSRPPAVRTA